MDNNKSKRKPSKILDKKYIFGKAAGCQPATLSINEPHHWYFSSNLTASEEPLLQSRLKEKVTILKLNEYYFVPYFQPLQFVRSTDRWSIFYETKKNCLINTVCFRVRLMKEYMEITE